MSALSRSPSASHHRRSHSEMTNESEDPRSTDQSSSDVKRVRLNPTNEEEQAEDNDTQNSSNGEEQEEEEEEEGGDDDDDETQEPEQPSRPPVAAPGVNKQGYKQGAIVRIKVTDFVTYTKAEFHPGPKLNMVIGPNGTGKSTLVCAICLGLGWGPQHLGRAKELGEFVKHGRPEATIEIELAAGPTLSANPTIKRRIKRDGNQSSFWVNGSPASAKQVLKFAQSIGIQVDNLCQFLPQDKVAEFAALTPEQLLYSTERAAGGKIMTDWHDALNSLREEQRKIEVDNRAETETLRNLQTRHDAQREDVERMRERVVIQQKIDNLEFLRPVVEYKECTRSYQELKNKVNGLTAEKEQLKKDAEPFKRIVDDKNAYSIKIDEIKALRKEQVTQLSNAADAAKGEISDLQQNITNIDGDIENERKSGRRLKEEAQKIIQTIKNIERRIQEEPVEFDPQYFNDLLSEKRQEKRAIEEKTTEIRNRQSPLQRQAEEAKRRIESNERQLENLNSKSGQRENKLSKLSRDSAAGYRWLQSNQHRFEKEVFGPPILTCSVKDPKYADAVESCMQKSDFLAFTVQNRNDFQTLQRALMKEMKLHEINIRTCPSGIDWKRNALPRETIEQWGFDGWASDFVEGPDPVIGMLYEEVRLGNTPIALRKIPDEAFEEVTQTNIAQFVSGTTVYQTSRRREYANATSTKTRAVRRASLWTDQPVDMSVKQTFLNEIGSSREELQHLKGQLQEESSALQKLLDDASALDREERRIKKEKDEAQKAHTHFLALPQTLEQENIKLKVRQDGFTAIRERVSQLRNQQDEIAIKKAEAAVRYANAIEKVREAFQELIKVEVLHMEAVSDYKTLGSRQSESGRLLQEKLRELRVATEEQETEKKRGRAMRIKVSQISQETPNRPGAEELSQIVCGYTMEEYEADLDSEKARLDLTHGGHSGMVEEFEARERRIQELKERLSGSEQEKARFQESINEIRSQWEPELEAIVSKISEAFGDSFRRIGLAGQVGLFKAEYEPGPNGEAPSNFEQWAIQIQVKFREHEPLSILTAHRQSGGERAVSTIFYLMALQSLSKSPFRVVDEINQGMDPRNERMVHGRLVDIACGADDFANGGAANGEESGSQYFLITPKLLTGLSYKRGMRVLTIYSGEHMPDDYGTLDFKVAAQKMRTITGQRAAGQTAINAY